MTRGIRHIAKYPATSRGAGVAANLTPGSRFDYELVVTNNQNVPIAIPRTLDWKEIDQGRPSQNFVRATLSVHMECLEDELVRLNNELGGLDYVVLYGSDERPGTEIMLGPVESVRILGMRSSGSTLSHSYISWDQPLSSL